MTATVGEIMEDAADMIGEIAGSGSQTFGEDRMRKDVARCFDMLFKKYPWHQYRRWFNLQLDGTLGIVTTNELEHVRDFEDIFFVGKHGNSQPLPIAPFSLNPFTMGTSTSLRFWSALHVDHANYATRKLQFYPMTATDSVDVGCRLYPNLAGGQWIETDTMYLDRHLLMWGTVFMTLMGDDTNPGQAELAKNMMESRFRDITGQFADQAISFVGGSDIPTDWRVA